jgi:hypothetical protein
MATGRCRWTGKKKFRDQIAAAKAIGSARSKPLRERVEKGSYLCERCRFWHVTSWETPDRPRSA